MIWGILILLKSMGANKIMNSTKANMMTGFESGNEKSRSDIKYINNNKR
jgi:hypothetical protein